MDGYATFSRVEQVRLGRVADRDRDVKVLEAAADGDTIDADVPPLDLLIGERVARVRELWSQTTFFLFDAQSWR